jgi:hypothetical protein
MQLVRNSLGPCVQNGRRGSYIHLTSLKGQHHFESVLVVKKLVELCLTSDFSSFRKHPVRPGNAVLMDYSYL